MVLPSWSALPCPLRRTALATLLLVLLLPLLAPPPAAAQGRPGWAVERLAGESATVLSAAVSNRTVVETDVVVIARGDDYPDALAGAPLAGLLGAPILLTDRAELPPHVYSEIDRLGIRTAVLLGGTHAIDPAVEATLRERLSIPEVRRIGGGNRFETAALIAREVTAQSGATAAYLARGEHATPTRAWPDAVAVSALATAQGRPILLAGDDRLPAETREAMDAAGIRDVTVVGGVAAVSDAIGQAVADTGRSVDRVAGDSRFATSLAVADRAVADGASMRETWLVTGGAYADALVSSVAVARAGGVMLMVDGARWADSAARQRVVAAAGDIDRVTVVGDPDAVPHALDHDLVVQRVGAPPRPDTAGGVRIGVGQRIQDVVDANPPGTTFVLASGVHRMQAVVPRSGDRFVGEPGAVMNGALPIPASSFSRLPDGRWAAPAPAGDPAPHDPRWEIEPGFERHGDPSDLWAGHVRLDHVNALDMVDRPGTWFYDYAGDRVVVFDDPAGLGPVELATTPQAFTSPPGARVADVTIENLVITRYGNSPTVGALDASSGRHWRIRHVEVVETHAVGIKVGPGSVVERSRSIRNGQMGISGTDTDVVDGYTAPVTVEGNEVAFNGELRFVWAWEAGSIKFGATDGLVLRGNWVHSHRGPGPWMDVDAVRSSITSNLVEFNMLNGIMYEISRDGVIADNTIRHNGVLAYGDLGSGLWISNSQQVRIERNLIEGNRLPINLQSSPVEAGSDGERVVRDVVVQGNDIRIDYLAPGMRVTSDDAHLYEEGGNRFDGNTYRLRPESDRNFYWGAFYTIDGWQRDLGHDLTGRFLGITTPGSPPSAGHTLTPAGAA